MRHVLAEACLLFLVCHAAGAQEGVSPPHVRSDSEAVRGVVADGVRRSTTFRALIEAIDRTDLVVYVRVSVRLPRALEGRIGIVGAAAGARFVVIELACPRSTNTLIATLAHELEHAIEIARAPWVIDARTLGEYYQSIGNVAGEGFGLHTFETIAARAIGDRVRRELAGSAVAPP